MTHADGEICVVYDSADFRSLYSVSPQARRNLLKVPLWIFLVGIFFSFGDGNLGLNLLLGAWPFAIGGLLAVVSIYWLIPFRQVQLRRKSGWDSPLCVSLFPDGVHTRHRNQDTQFHWSAIERVVSRAGRIYIFTTPVCALILPRRFFDNDAAFSEFAALASLYWTNGRERELNDVQSREPKVILP
ncbi:YcxB family protein [Sphingomonas sp. ASV193]|uniref:YcxB family protein n=1 Tax=Sphingomonas sp. ASV193 TaxID=3144405 RepID=UPI0032E88F97